MRPIIKTVVLALLLVLGGHARANEPKVTMLSCEGTLTRTYGANEPADPEPMRKTGVVVNLVEQTVFFLGYVVPIESVDGFSIAIRGHIDRASGRMAVTTATLDPIRPTILTLPRFAMT